MQRKRLTREVESRAKRNRDQVFYFGMSRLRRPALQLFRLDAALPQGSQLCAAVYDKANSTLLPLGPDFR
jgi:hypothetical protein